MDRLRTHSVGTGPTLGVPGERLTDWVELQAWTQPDQVAFVYLVDGGEDEVRIAYGEVARRARGIASGLVARGLQERRVALLLPPGIDYVVALLGCFYAGAVAVPILPARAGAAFDRLRSILGACEAGLALVPEGVDARLDIDTATVAELESAEVRPLPAVDPAAIAFLQYTSGSTATPRGAMVSHANLVANIRTMAFDGEGPCVSWLPPHHDMGLIGTLLQTFARGIYTVMLSPLHFVQRPVRWLRAMSRFRGVGCPAPDFGYRLCVERIDDADLEGLDLSSWRFALSGAEKVSPETLDAFCRRFEPLGFRRDAFTPCYGLAEATLMVSCAPVGGPTIVAVDGEALEHRRVVVQADGRRIVSCGRVVPHTEVVIVPEADGEDVGEIWVRGPGVVQGYFGDPEGSARCFGVVHPERGGGFLRTGDLGFLLDDALYVTGRVKDTIVLRGRSLQPDDVEASARAADPSLHDAHAAAFSDQGEVEGLVVCIEVGRSATEALAERVAEQVASDVGVRPRRVVLVRRRGIPYTTSGKVRRAERRRRLTEGALGLVEEWSHAPVR